MIPWKFKTIPDEIPTHTLVWKNQKVENKSVAKDAQKLKVYTSCFGVPKQMGTYENRLEVFQMIHIEILQDYHSFLDIYPNRNGNMSLHKRKLLKSSAYYYSQ